MHLVHQVVIEFGDGGVYLDLHPCGLGQLYAADGGIKGAFLTTELVMLLSRREIQGHRNAGDVMLGHGLGNLLRDDGGIGADNGVRPLFVGVICNVPDVGTHQRLTPSENQDGVCDGGDVVNNRLALLKGQLPWVMAKLRGRPAVGAGQVTRAGNLPGHDAGSLYARALLKCRCSRTGTRPAHGSSACRNVLIHYSPSAASHAAASLAW